MRTMLFLLSALLVSCNKEEQKPVPSAPGFSDDSGFTKMCKPQPGDWLESFHENGQTFEQYLDEMANRKDETKKVIYIQPLGDCKSEILEKMREFAGIFFGLEARIRNSVPLLDAAFREDRRGYDGKGQYDSTILINNLRMKVPEDALIFAGITDRDLFSKGLNFVFGEGSLQNRCGVYSLLRLKSEDGKLFLRRALALMVHEMGHIISINHCIYYECIMNGSNSLSESDRRTLFACPIDLRKICHNTGVDPKSRYLKLAKFFEREGLKAEVEFASAQSGKF